MNPQTAASSFRDFADDIGAMVDEMMGKPFIRFSPGDAWRPRVNLYETPSAFVLCIDLAGMAIDEIRLEAQGAGIMLRGRRPPPIPPDLPAEGVRVHLMEIDHGEFCRVVELPLAEASAPGVHEIESEYRNGMLWVTIRRR